MSTTFHSFLMVPTVGSLYLSCAPLESPRPLEEGLGGTDVDRVLADGREHAAGPHQPERRHEPKHVFIPLLDHREWTHSA
ncbi:hypothetical protein BC830DRAFT_1117727 [Chytriomyces sp. MP71]|nr:hypothetical protein BC830DRAFT_1117727 [Chytriomyces sp. MP71]